MPIQSLIDKQDNFEIIREQIGLILKTEETSQQALALAGGKDPALWALRVFTERSNPWELFGDYDSDHTPIVNVWFETGNFNPSASNVVEKQECQGLFNVDVYGYGESKSDGGTGHIPGDHAASIECQRAVRLVRNILMASEYTYLKLRGTVWRRMISSTTIFQPQQDDQNADQIVGARIAFRVDFSELSPQYEGEPLEILTTEVRRQSTGELLFDAEYQY